MKTKEEIQRWIVIKDAYNRQPVKLREEQNLTVNWLARLKGVGGNRHTGEPG